MNPNDIQGESSSGLTDDSRKSDLRKLRYLWIGLGTYFLIMLNAIRIGQSVPYQIFIVGALLNGAIIVSIVVAMQRVYSDCGSSWRNQ